MHAQRHRSSWECTRSQSNLSFCCRANTTATVWAQPRVTRSSSESCDLEEADQECLDLKQVLVFLLPICVPPPSTIHQTDGKSQEQEMAGWWKGSFFVLFTDQGCHISDKGMESKGKYGKFENIYFCFVFVFFCLFCHVWFASSLTYK